MIGQWRRREEEHDGPVALAYAAAHPERISLLILWAAYADPHDFFQTGRVQALLRMIDLDWDLFLRNAWLEIVAWEDRDTTELLVSAGARDLGPRALVRAFGQLQQNDVSPLLPTLPVPVLIMQPQEARAPTIATARRLATTIPDAQLLPVTGASIVPLRSDAEAVQAAIVAALRRARGLPAPPHLSPLRPRQTETLALVAAGLTNAAIAQRLAVSLSTVKKDLAQIYERLGVQNRTQAVTRARDLGLLP